MIKEEETDDGAAAMATKIREEGGQARRIPCDDDDAITNI